MTAQATFVRAEMAMAMPPPLMHTGVAAWLRQRFFGGVVNSLLTIVCAALLVALLWPTVKFLIVDAVWVGTSRDACLQETAGREVGACWPFIAAKFNQFMYGFYPREQQWRVTLTYAIGVILLVPLL